MAIYTVTITGQSDLEATWNDSSVPHMSFGYIQVDIEECTDLGDGTYEATYETLELTSSRNYTYIDPVNGETTYTLAAGEYGVKP